MTAAVPRLSWTGPTGAVWRLDDPDAGWFASAGVQGLGAMPVEFATDPRDRGGEDVRRIQPGPRFITLPLFIEGPDHATFLSRWRDLAGAFTATRYAGPGQLTVERPDGTSRVIDAYYSAGWDGDPDGGVTADVLVLTLRCPQPWFQDPTAVTIVNSYDSGNTDFLDPYPSVSSGSTFGAVTITNIGGVEVWPSWTVVGPASQIVAASLTTGESWTILPSATGHGNLLAGETVTVVTDPPSVRGPAGENWTSALDWPGAVLWRLIPGANEIEYTATGSGVGTTITLTYVPRYETA